MATPDPVLLGVPIELLRSRACLASSDDSRDVEITAAFTAALDTVGDYLDRELTKGEYTEIETHFSGSVMSLRAYPLESVSVVISGDGYEPPFHADKRNGQIKFDGHQSLHTLNCTYVGGYAVLPSTLMLAMLPVFDQVWALTSNAAGAVSTKEVKATVIDGTRIEYFDPNSSSSNNGATDLGVIPAATIEMLQPYRRMAA